MNKVVGIGIVIIAIAIGIAAISFSNNDNSNTIITQVGPFAVESSNEFSEEEGTTGNDYSIRLSEKIGVKAP